MSILSLKDVSKGFGTGTARHEVLKNINLEIDNNIVNLFIENSKPDTLPTQDHQRKSGGIGLVNVRRRLNLLYPNQYELKIGDNPKTYAVNLQIELDN